MFAKSMRRALIVGAALIGAMLAPAAVATETSAAPKNSVASTVRLSVSSDGSGVNRMVVLRCHPTGGNHKHTVEACAQLDQVGGSFTALQAEEPRACTLEYAPVMVSATGAWRGSEVRFEETYSNMCALRVETGVVFDF
ncbi:SSI family serine proteinase inhibitor [Saccharopolyspora mangrovi]|uniref:SSI family serine proteinase inhibitor n=1 Tax=Saccharopolyspora mangrovi TaxID=3082379 RepID=A0ABU6AFZ2_9PSEU|nr:SSI family serine proteinase inhibitor [Saccharopolyspora sp. S2-29]MEB3370245.1 SSI family serine proteinase inhibitor [Saccharopolyspora sp. S2-29]